MSDTLTTLDGMMKQYYSDEKVMNLIYDSNPFLTMVDKDEGFVGNAMKVPVIYAGAQGVGHTFSTAQTQASNTNNGIAGFLVSTRASMYGVAVWSRELMLASATDAGAFLSEAKVAVENLLRTLGNQIATALYRSGFGDQGNIQTGSSVSGTTITLQNTEDIVNFEVGQNLVVSATQNGSLRALGSSGNALIVTGVDRTSGILTFGFAVNDGTNGIPTIAAGDYIFIQGNHTSSTALMPYGIESWVPATTPSSSDSFWGVNRSSDTRLSGQRLNGTAGQSLEELLIEGAQIVGREGGKLSHYFMSFNTYARLLKQMQGRVILTSVETDTGIGFRGATVQTPTGEVLVIPDRTCPMNRIYGLELSSWSLASLGKFIAPVEEDGLMILRASTADNFETRYGGYMQLVCRAPGHNINIQIPTS